MLTQDLRERIRRAYYIDHKSIRQISAEVGHSRDTISRVVAENPPDASERPRRNKPSPVFGPFQQRIDELMERNERLPKNNATLATRFLRFCCLRATRAVTLACASTSRPGSESMRLPTSSFHWSSSRVRMPNVTGVKPLPLLAASGKPSRSS